MICEGLIDTVAIPGGARSNQRHGSVPVAVAKPAHDWATAIGDQLFLDRRDEVVNSAPGGRAVAVVIKRRASP